ncbi:MAG: DNA polymerase III subunit beta [Fusobacteriaceae bacterium]
MEVRVNRVEFLKKLKTIEKAITENKIKPIISCAYIEIVENSLKFYGTNLEITIVTSMEAEVKETGKIVFQHQIVEEYLKELNDEYFLLKSDNLVLTIETEDSATEFSLFDSDEFPKNHLIINIENEINCFNIDSLELVETFEKTKFAASQSSDDMRINCIRIESNNNKMMFVGTDTYRLVYLEKEISSSEKFSLSLPLNTVDVITKLFRSFSNENVKVIIGTKHIKFEIGGTVVISRIIDLPYPDYKGILGNLKHSKNLNIGTSEFLNMLKRVIIFVKNNNDSKFGAIFSLEGDKISITGSNDIAKIKEESIVNYNGESIKISLNTKFLIEFINNLDQNSKMSLDLSDSSGSVRIIEEGKDNYLYIVMPLALRA